MCSFVLAAVQLTQFLGSLPLDFVFAAAECQRAAEHCPPPCSGAPGSEVMHRTRLGSALCLALSLSCDCCLGQALAPCAICVLMGSAISGGVQGASPQECSNACPYFHDAGREHGHPTCGYLQEEQGNPPLSQSAPAPCMHICHSANAVRAELLTCPAGLLFSVLVAGAVRGQAKSREPRCVCCWRAG